MTDDISPPRDDEAGPDRLVRRLRELTAPAPDTLTDAVFDRWVSTDSLVGPVLVAYTREGISFLRTTDTVPGEAFREAYRRRFGRPLRPTDTLPDGLDAVLTGRTDARARVDLRGLSDFERDVLAATRTIPAGQTRPYAWVAAEVGRPRAVRAAGSVLARNPVPLLVPCHRVVRSDGSPGRYIFGDDRKQQLLRNEHATRTADLDARGWTSCSS